MIDFPSSPTTGQSFTYSGRTWTFNGNGWVAAGAGGVSNYAPPTSTVSAKMYVEEATGNGSNKVTLTVPDALSADATVNLPTGTGDILSNGESKNLTKGFTATGYPAGTKSIGTFDSEPCSQCIPVSNE